MHKKKRYFKLLDEHIFISVQPKKSFVSSLTVHLQISCVPYHSKNQYPVGHELSEINAMILKLIIEGSEDFYITL